jgi:hypothetical protein
MCARRRAGCEEECSGMRWQRRRPWRGLECAYGVLDARVWKKRAAVRQAADGWRQAARALQNTRRSGAGGKRSALGGAHGISMLSLQAAACWAEMGSCPQQDSGTAAGHKA